MPLIKKPSKKAVSKNIESEMDTGKPQKQSIAIALSVQKKARKKHMAAGGEVDEDITPGPASIVDGIRAKRKPEGSDTADLNLNADEDLNYEDQLSFDAGREQNYAEEDGLEQMGSPEDSNLHGQDLSSGEAKDIVTMLRARMKAKRA